MQATTNTQRPWALPAKAGTTNSDNTHTSNGAHHACNLMLRAAFALTLAFAFFAQPAAAMVPGPGSTHDAPSAGHTSDALPSAGAPTNSLYFASTGKTVMGDFLSVYQRFGLSRIGYPISDERNENGTRVQYFERVRMEYHPELAGKGYGVLMTRLGAQMTAGSRFDSVAAFKSTSTNLYVPQTGHALAEPFLSYWKKNGGVELFGYPISEVFSQDGLKVQWFERARFEYHPEGVKSGTSVQLSLLGSMAYQLAGGGPVAPAPAPAENKTVQQAAAPAPAAPARNVELSGMESYMLSAVNEQRVAAGLVPVKIDASVTDIARSRSNDMASRSYFSHNTPEGANFLAMLGSVHISYKYAGEILARNNYPDNEAGHTALDSYLTSPPHKAIMLDGRYNLVGIGYARSGDGMHYFTVIFLQQ